MKGNKYDCNISVKILVYLKDIVLLFLYCVIYAALLQIKCCQNNVFFGVNIFSKKIWLCKKKHFASWFSLLSFRLIFSGGI